LAFLHTRPLNNDISRWAIPARSERLTLSLDRLYQKYKQCMVQIRSEKQNGQHVVGAGFHIGDGYVVTARHVVDQGAAVSLLGGPHNWGKKSVRKSFLPSDPAVDLALLETDFNLEAYMTRTTIVGQPPEDKVDHVPIGAHLDDWLGDELVMTKALLMGYPPIPLARGSSDYPLPVAVEAEINAVIDRREAPHPHFVVSTIPRHGFSGGPLISQHDVLLGVLTVSLFLAGQPVELGYAAALSVEPLWNLLHENRVYPASNAEFLREVYDGIEPEQETLR